MKERNKTIDFFRVIAALLVVSIHTKSGGLLIQIVARSAVPYFYCVTGYYYGKKVVEFPDKGYYKKWMISILETYIIVSVPYVLIFIYQNRGNYQGIISEVLKGFFINGIWYHLWYFPMLIYAVFLLTFIKKEILFVISVICWIFLCMGDAYYSITLKIDAFYQIYSHEIYSSFMRPVFYAIVFVSLGAFIAKYEKKINSVIRHKWIAILGCLGVLILEEILTVKYCGNIKLTMALGVYPLISCFMVWTLEDPLKNVKLIKCDFRRLANFIYFWHPFLLFFVHRRISSATISWFIVVICLCLLNFVMSKYVKHLYKLVTR